MENKNRLFLVFFFLCMLFPAFPKGTVKLSLVAPDGSNEVGLGDKYYIYYKLDNVSGEPSEPASVPGSNKLSFSFSSSSSRIVSVNGRTEQSTSRTYVLYLRAKAEGNYTFGPVTVGGVKSNTLHFKITGRKSGSGSTARGNMQSASASSSDANSEGSQGSGPRFIGKGDSHLFLKASVNKINVYEQEALEYTVKLYTTYSRIKFIGATESPKFDGFVVEDTKKTSDSFSYETYNGQTYATAIIARYVIFPQKSGKLKITGNTYTVSADRSEYFADEFFSHMTVYQPVQLNVTPNDLVIDVKSLPTPIPADFSGGVGKFSISSQLPSADLLTNNAASVIYTITGSGNLKYVKLPELNNLFPPQLEVYSPKTEVNVNVGTTNISGSVKFDYSIMPLEVGRFEIPQVTLVYFNPETGSYETSVARGYSVNVGKGASSDKSQTKERTRFDSKLLPNGSNLSMTHVPFVLTWTYWMFYLIPAICLVGAYIVWNQRKKLMADENAFRSRIAGKVASARLKRAYMCMKKKDETHFYDEMLKALFGYIGDKLKMPTSEISRSNVKSVLESHDVENELINQLISLIDECEFAKYSSNGAAMDMTVVYDKGSKVIDSLEKSFSKKDIHKQ